jgi:hypothetical protein
VLIGPPDTDDEGSHEVALAAARDAGLELPLVAKPDIGQRGAGVRRIDSADDLAQYMRTFPTGERMILQELVDQAFFARQEASETTSPQAEELLPPALQSAQEAGVLYWRTPDAARGEIVSLTLKLLPAVVGNGRHTLAELIDADLRAHKLRDTYRARHWSQLDRVLADGEHYPLVFAGNHCQGAIFKDGTDLVSDALRQRVEEIAAAVPGLCFARFDIRFRSLRAFLSGKGFRIVEINGAGAEATHIWDADARLIPSYQMLFRQFRTLFEIGQANRRHGVEPLPVASFLRDIRAYKRLATTYPRAD